MVLRHSTTPMQKLISARTGRLPTNTADRFGDLGIAQAPLLMRLDLALPAAFDRGRRGRVARVAADDGGA
jgi:hypothetical protein